MFLLSHRVRGLFYGESNQYTWHDGATHFVGIFRGLGLETNIFHVFIVSESQGPILRGIQLVWHIGPTHLFDNLRGIGDETITFNVFFVSESQGPILRGIYPVYLTWWCHSFCRKFQGPASWDKHIHSFYWLRKSRAHITGNLSSHLDTLVQLICLKI